MEVVSTELLHDFYCKRSVHALEILKIICNCTFKNPFRNILSTSFLQFAHNFFSQFPSTRLVNDQDREGIFRNKLYQHRLRPIP